MKNGLLALNLVLLVAVGVLFYLHFSKPATVAAEVKTPVAKAEGGNGGQTRIAYFEMDSIENSFAMVKDVKAELDRQEETMRNELGRMEKEYRNKAAQYQAQAVNMNQTQSELAQRDMLQTQQVMQNREQQLKQVYQDLQMRKLQDVRNKIEAFLKEYNKNSAYSYIVSYEPGLIFYKDSAYNITADVIKGLNAQYKTASSKK